MTLNHLLVYIKEYTEIVVFMISPYIVIVYLIRLSVNPLEPSGNFSYRFKTMLFLREYNKESALMG